MKKNRTSRKMKYQHGDPEIAKKQVRTLDTVEDGLDASYDDTLYTEFALNYSLMMRKIKKCDPELAKEVREIVSRHARGTSPTNACIASEFARKHLIPNFGGFVYFVDDDDGVIVKQQIRQARPAIEESDGIYANGLPEDINDNEWEHIINGVSWSWKEVTMLILHANQQLYA